MSPNFIRKLSYENIFNKVEGKCHFELNINHLLETQYIWIWNKSTVLHTLPKFTYDMVSLSVCLSLSLPPTWSGIIPAIARDLVHNPLVTGNKLRQVHSLKAWHTATRLAGAMIQRWKSGGGQNNEWAAKLNSRQSHKQARKWRSE